MTMMATLVPLNFLTTATTQPKSPAFEEPPRCKPQKFGNRTCCGALKELVSKGSYNLKAQGKPSHPEKHMLDSPRRVLIWTQASSFSSASGTSLQTSFTTEPGAGRFLPTARNPVSE
eukprot:5146346-Amphidinium_carterae.1